MDHSPPVTGVLLAAGAGSRFGGRKLLHRLADGTPIGIAAWRNLTQALPASLVVVRTGDDELERAFIQVGARVVRCDDAAQGMGHSLACGIRASPDAAGWVIALADMPRVAPESILEVARQVQGAGGRIAVPFYRGTRGHPVGFSASHRAALLALQGDAGARALLQQCSADVVRVELDDPGILQDVDTREDAAKLADAAR